jgi:hypothetical protein
MGLQYAHWKSLIRMDEASPSSIEPVPEAYAVTRGVRSALETYVSRYPGRPLDGPGLVWALLTRISDRARIALQDGGLSIPNAVRALAATLGVREMEPSEDLVSSKLLSGFRMSETVATLLAGANELSELAKFVADGKTPGQYTHLLLLLAVITGAPTLSTEVFQRLRKSDPERPLADFAAEAPPPDSSREAEWEWERVQKAIRSYAERHPEAAVGDLQPHLREISRYSFREPTL